MNVLMKFISYVQAEILVYYYYYELLLIRDSFSSHLAPNHTLFIVDPTFPYEQAFGQERQGKTCFYRKNLEHKRALGAMSGL